MPIRLRLALLFALGTAALIGFGGWMFMHEQSTQLRRSATEGLWIRTNAVARSLTQAKDEDAYRGSLTGIAAWNEQDEVYQIIDPTGNLKVDGGAKHVSLLDRAQLRQAQRDKLLFERALRPGESNWLLLATPLSRPAGTVQVTGTSLRTVDAAVAHTRLSLEIGGPLGVVLAGLAAWLVAAAALRPVERMRRQAAEISEHDRDARLELPPTRDEIAALGQTLNGLLARLEEALHRQRGFVAVAGHELRSPLANLKVELELAGRPHRSRAELATAVAEAAAEVDRLSRLTEDLLTLASFDEPGPLLLSQVQDMVKVVAGAVERFGRDAERRAVTVTADVPAMLVAPIDDVRFGQVVDNLLDNALRFAPPGSTVEVSLRAEPGVAVLAVADRGPGFPPEFLPRAFERFSRPDTSRARHQGGAGLGLAIVKAVAEAHGGQVSAANSGGGGAIVRVTIPRPGRMGLKAARVTATGRGTVIPPVGPTGPAPAGTARDGSRTNGTAPNGTAPNGTGPRRQQN